MDDATRRHWEQIADRCFERAYQEGPAAGNAQAGQRAGAGTEGDGNVATPVARSRSAARCLILPQAAAGDRNDEGRSLSNIISLLLEAATAA